MTLPSSPRWARAVLVVATALLVAPRLLGWTPFEGLEHTLYDRVLVPLLPDLPPSERLALVAIDDHSLAEVGERWPLSRETWATFVTRLAAHEPAAIVIDVVFDQPSEDDVLELAAEVRRRVEASRHGDSEGARALLAIVDDTVRAHDGDLLLANAIAQAGDVTLGVLLSEVPGFLAPAVPLAPLAVPSGEGDTAVALSLPGLVASTPRIFLAAHAHGAMNVLVDPDGVVRRYPLVVEHAGALHPSLALSALLGPLTGADANEAVRRALGADRAAPHLRFGTTFPRLSYSDVLLGGALGEAAAQRIKGRVVFVGATAAGIEDLVNVPNHARLAGVEVHAAALENLLRETLLTEQGASSWLSFGLVLVLVGGFAWLLGRRPRARIAIAVGLALVALHLALAVALAQASGHLIALAPVPLGLLALGAAEAWHRWRWSRLEQVRLGERERLLEAERIALQRFRSVVEHVADAIVSVDEGNRIRWMNPAAESLFQRRARTAVDRPVAELVARFEAHTKLGEVLEAHARVGTEMIPVEATATAMQVGDEQFTNFVFRDVAARKALERQKDELLASINHELRTPITSILGSLRLVSGGAMGELPDRVRELLGIAEKNGERLLALVSDLLDAARIDAGRLTLEKKPISVPALLEEGRARYEGFGMRFSVGLRVAPLDSAVTEAVVGVDRERVLQVFGNLVSNAVKHSNPGSDVVLSAQLRPAGRARILVSDLGPGIPPEAHDQIFERFSMTVAGDGKRRPGTGLGLAIAKGIVEAHGGTIGFDTQVGVGTTFWFELPTLA